MANLVRQSSLTSLDPMKRNFKNMLYRVWRTKFDADPQPLMYDFADRFQHGPANDVLMGFRGFSKSYIAVTCCAWVHHCDQEALILNLAGSGNASGGNADLYWGMINGFDWLAHLKPSGLLRHSAHAFDVAGSTMEKSESFAALSIFSGDKTGRRADFALADDIETPTTSSTETDRAELRKHFSEVGSAILRSDRGWRWNKLLGTPQTEDTLYTELAQEKGYGMRIYPVLYPSPSEMVHYGPWLDPKIKQAVTDNPTLAATSTMPGRFPESDIEARKLEWGTTEFNRQFLLWTDVGKGVARPLHLRDIPVVSIPVPTPSHPLKVPSELRWEPLASNRVANLQVDSLNGDSEMFHPADTKEYRDYWQKPEGVIIQVDPSGGGADETVAQALAQHVGRVFLLDQEAYLEGFTDSTLMGIARMAKRWGANKVRIEKNFGGGMFAALLRPKLLEVGHACAIEEDFATGQKEVRIVDTLEAVITGHRLVINLPVLQADFSIKYPTVADAKRRYYRLTYQITRITKEKNALTHDDRVDDLASGVGSFLGSLSRQLEEAARESRDMILNRDVDHFIAEQARQRDAMGPNLKRPLPGGAYEVRTVLLHGGGLRGSPLFRGRSR